MLQIIVVALALVAVALAAPVVEYAKIEEYENERTPEGGYKASFKSSDAISRSEEGTLKEVFDEEKKPHVVLVVRGSYAYPDEEGRPIEIQYYADENGYHAEGNSIPKLN